MNCVFNTACCVPERLMRTQSHEHVRHGGHHDTQEGVWLMVRPDGSFALFGITECNEGTVVFAVPLDCIESASDSVKACGIYQDIKLMLLPICSLDSISHNACDRRLLEVDQVNVGPVVHLEIAALEWHASRAKTVVLGDETFCRLRIVHSLTDLVCYKLRVKLICLSICVRVGEDS